MNIQYFSRQLFEYVNMESEWSLFQYFVSIKIYVENNKIIKKTEETFLKIEYLTTLIKGRNAWKHVFRSRPWSAEFW